MMTARMPIKALRQAAERFGQGYYDAMLAAGQVEGDELVVDPAVHVRLMEERRAACREREKARGLGDTVAAVTKATGISRVVKTVTAWLGIPCGCADRQEALNRAFPYDPGPGPGAR
jgi:hypothetical protein